MRRRTQRPDVTTPGVFHYAMAAAAAAVLAFTALMIVLYYECSPGAACVAIATPERALLSVGPGALVAAALAWLRAVRRARREER